MEHISDAVHEGYILVAEEYRNAMSEFRNNIQHYKKGACIFGQHGIGKSTFLVYAIIERLRERQPVAVQVPLSGQKGPYILFTRSGTTIHNHDDPTLHNYGSDLWAFSDIDEYSPQPTKAFRVAPGSDEHIRVFRTSSSANKHWGWSVTSGLCAYIMDLWSFEEIENLGRFVLNYEPEVIVTMLSLAREYGPVPATLREISVNPGLRDQFRGMVEGSISLAVANQDTLIRGIVAMSHPPDAAPSRIFFIRPLRKSDTIRVSRNTYEVYVPTKTLVDKLVARISDSGDARGAEFFYMMTINHRCHSVGERIFELVVHQFFIRTKSITIHWYNDHQALQTIAFHETLDTDSDLNSALSFYWRPRESNYPGIDGAIFTEDHVYLIQATMSGDRPSLQEGVDKLWNDVPSKKRKLQWKMVFVGPFEDRIAQVAATHAQRLQYGAAGTRSHLPVGWFHLYPNVIPSIFEF
ncbi:hypothetical protein L210DRAFT_3553990 [Boletus edulis BED1]|uniref:Uncharacterized protein n=1 Tax=Boletus edulis BED1 TaxID=1328754 RepID=A0AAD4GAQ6_BOLED|nr:hypothetical protein L210DRAFT_3553990 [Boletus edulis BED1]